MRALLEWLAIASVGVLAISGDAEYSINVGIWATVFAIWGTIWGIRDEIKKAAK